MNTSVLNLGLWNRARSSLAFSSVPEFQINSVSDPFPDFLIST